MADIGTCLWFDRNAQQAVDFYTAVFPDSEVLGISYYGENMPLPAGTVLTLSFRLGERQYTALNGGPVFRFNEAISQVVSCASQEEIDYYWEALLEGGGKPQQCGWLRDRFGLSWQVVPCFLQQMLQDPDPGKVQRVMDTLMPMVKLDSGCLSAAFEGRTGSLM